MKWQEGRRVCESILRQYLSEVKDDFLSEEHQEDAQRDERVAGEDYCRGRERRKKHSSNLAVLIGLPVTAGAHLHRKAREVVRIHLGANIHISNTHRRLRNFGQLMKRTNEKMVGMNMGF